VLGKASVPEFNRSTGKIVVLKVGGSVLTGVKAFRRTALFLKRRCELAPSEKLAVVVSAQKLATDTLERRARRILHNPSLRALDLLWSTAELRSVALLTLHLEALKVSSVGLNVQETGLRFSAEHEGRPALMGHHLETVLSKHDVVIVPGFLATRPDGVIASVGRGGSDLSAVLLAIGLGASRCELVKDVPGYFEEDPRENARARHIPSLTFDDALQMANRGCELVQTRALLTAAEINLPLVIRSMDEEAPFSVISSRSKRESGGIHFEPVGTKA
jgi:aspartate kinase